MNNLMIALKAQTSIHAGTGQSVGGVDLPIQRESHTGWPCVFGSAVKGAMRSHAENSEKKMGDSIAQIFGHNTDNASEHAGCVGFTDARLLLLPVRSLTGHFKLCTCPAVIKRWRDDMAMIGLNGSTINVPADPPAEQIFTNNPATLFLEEMQFTASNSENLTLLIEALVKMGVDQSVLENQLVILNNDDFAHFCQTATAITPHIAINYSTKTVKSGALWHEESLPPESLLYTMAMIKSSRKIKKEDDQNPQETLSAPQVKVAFQNIFPNQSWLQIGGNETVGMGWCRIKYFTI